MTAAPAVVTTIGVRPECPGLAEPLIFEVFRTALKRLSDQAQALGRSQSNLPHVRRRRAVQWAVLGALAFVGVVVVSVLGWREYSAYQERVTTQEVETTVKHSMQRAFNTDMKLVGYSLTVKAISLVHKAGNEYVGSVELSSYKLQADKTVGINVVNDGSSSTWKIVPDDLESLAKELVEAS